MQGTYSFCRLPARQRCPSGSARGVIRINTIPPLTFWFGLVDSPLTLRCALRLGITGRDDQGRYRLGTIAVK